MHFLFQFFFLNGPALTPLPSLNGLAIFGGNFIFAATLIQPKILPWLSEVVRGEISAIQLAASSERKI